MTNQRSLPTGTFGSSGTGLRCLVLIEGSVDDHVRGPGIRGWEIARGLSARYSVTAAVRTGVRGAVDGIRVVPFTRRRVLWEALRSDVVLAPWLPPYLYPLIDLGKRRLAVADLYDPVELELTSAVATPDQAAEAAAAKASTDLQLRFADVVICAAGRRRRQLEHRLADATGEPPALLVVPFGVRASIAEERHEPVALPGAGPTDTVVLWWGSMWRWLDPHSAIRAVAGLAGEHPGIKLYMTAGTPPDRRAEALSDAPSARRLARSLGVFESNVFFLDRWIPFQERRRYLGAADVGITLHRQTPEAAIAARARYMDYLAAGLPSVLTEGDEVGDVFARQGFAALVPAGDTEAIAQALARFHDEPETRARARSAAKLLIRQFSWSRVLEPLIAELTRGSQHRPRRRSTARVMPAVAAYYALRLRQKLRAIR
jgi:glycosyltransferase involved in cell wall biosynthesis